MTAFQQKHGRPKPPKIKSSDHIDYWHEHETYTVHKSPRNGRWYAFGQLEGVARTFPTHAEAINWAQKHAAHQGDQP